MHCSGRETSSRSGNCHHAGARRAGQGRGAAKRTLDAPKRSRKIGSRSDRKTRTRSLLESWAQHLRAPRQKRSTFCCFFLEETGAHVRADSPTVFPRAPQHISDTDMGRERPRRWALGPRAQRAGGVAHAFSLLRHLCWGVYGAAQTAAPSCICPASTTSGRSMGCGVTVTAVALELDASREIAATAGGGPTAPWPCVSLLGPL
jgi:hypothetical protein